MTSERQDKTGQKDQSWRMRSNSGEMPVSLACEQTSSLKQGEQRSHKLSEMTDILRPSPKAKQGRTKGERTDRLNRSDPLRSPGREADILTEVLGTQKTRLFDEGIAW